MNNSAAKNIIYIILIHGILNCSNSPSVQIRNVSSISSQKNDSSIFIQSESQYSYSLYYIDGIKGQPLNIPSNGQVEISSTKPVYLIESSANQTIYYLKPGDSVRFRLADKVPVFSSMNFSKEYEELTFFKKISDTTGSLRPLGKISYLKSRTSLQERDRLIDSVFKLRVNLLDEAFKTGKLSNMFSTMARRMFDQCRLNEKLSLYYPGYNKRELYSFYKDSLSMYKQYFNSCNDINSPVYKIALLHFVRLQIDDNNITQPMMFFDGLNTLQLQKAREVASEFIDCNKSYINGSVGITEMIQAKKMGKSINLASVLNGVKDEYLNRQLFREHGLLFGAKMTKFHDNQSLIRIDSTRQKLEVILKANKGNVLLVDNWATWCLPCIAELPKTKSIGQRYKEGLKVLYFSYDDDFNQWSSFIKSNSLINDSYLVEGAFNSSFAYSIKLDAVPRFLLFDQNGTLITDDAPRPGDPKLDTLLVTVLR